MDEIIKAKEKAENFIKKILEQSWKITYDKSFEDYDSSIEIDDWCLRFEGYSYLGNRHESNKKAFAIELQELWDKWINLSKKRELGTKKIFWPIREDYKDDVELTGQLDRYIGNEIENHISMFRIKEILKLGGYDSYFMGAKRRIEEILLNLNSLLWLDEQRIFWQIVRSPYLETEFSDHLKISFRIITESKPFRGLFGYRNIKVSDYMDFYGMALFFLSISDFDNKKFELAKKVSQILIKYQSENGSFNNNILTSCLIIASINITQADPSDSVCEKAINWILTKQDEEGFWYFLHGWSISWKILSTVIVLETIDLITDDKPMPIWAEKAKPSDILQRHPRIQIDKPLSAPEGINWSDVSIKFIGKDSVEIRAGVPLGVKNFIELGFKDRRTSSNPDQIWETLKLLAKNDGEIAWKDTDANVKLKPYIKDIRKRLKSLFNIDDDPFHSYRKVKTYRTKFKIWAREGALD